MKHLNFNLFPINDTAFLLLFFLFFFVLFCFLLKVRLIIMELVFKCPVFLRRQIS